MNRKGIFIALGVVVVLGLLGSYMYLNSLIEDDVEGMPVASSKAYEFPGYEIRLSESFSDVEEIMVEDAGDVFDLDSKTLSVVSKYEAELAAREGTGVVDPIEEVDQGDVEVPIPGIDESDVGESDNTPDTGTDAETISVKDAKEKVSVMLSESGLADRDRQVLHEMISEFSGYRVDALKRSVSGVESVGVMQVTTPAASDMAKRLGLTYKAGMEKEFDMNVKLGVAYYEYLKEISKDPHFIINAYILGPDGVKSIKSKNGNYETELSKKIVSRLR